MAAKFYWTTDGMEKIKQSRIQSMRIGRKVDLSYEVTETCKVPIIVRYMVFPVVNNKVYDKPIVDGLESEEEARAWIDHNFR